MQVDYIILCSLLIFVNITSGLTRANAGGQYQGSWPWPNDGHKQNRAIKKDNVEDYSDSQMDNAALDSMSEELQSDDDLETQIGKVGTKLFSNEDDKENTGLWPDKKVYYVFSPTVDREGRQEVKSVLREWEGNSCLRFVARGIQPRYIEFVYHGRCYVGEEKPDSKRIISIGSKGKMCSRGALLKGIGQAVGVKYLPDVYKRYFGPEETNVLGAELIGRARNLYKCDQIPADKENEGAESNN